MKLLLVIVAASVVLLAGCSKESTPASANEPPPPASGVTDIASGAFVSNIHPTSGTVRLVRDSSSGMRSLVFENFKTDNGPDLRVWLSRNTTAADYQEVGQLKAVSGNFSYGLGAGFDPAQYNYVLIWCEDFSVLFGHAVLN